MMCHAFRVALLALGLLALSTARAHPGGHGAHVHGEAQVQITLDGRELTIDLVAPGASVIGFERRARTPAEAAIVHAAAAYVRQAAWVRPDAAGACHLVTQQVDIAAFEPAGRDVGAHPDLVAHLRFTCAAAAQLRTITLDPFERFPSVERLRVEFVTPDAQGSHILTPRHAVVRLQP